MAVSIVTPPDLLVNCVCERGSFWASLSHRMPAWKGPWAAQLEEGEPVAQLCPVPGPQGASLRPQLPLLLPSPSWGSSVLPSIHFPNVATERGKDRAESGELTAGRLPGLSRSMNAAPGDPDVRHRVTAPHSILPPMAFFSQLPWLESPVHVPPLPLSQKCQPLLGSRHSICLSMASSHSHSHSSPSGWELLKGRIHVNSLLTPSTNICASEKRFNNDTVSTIYHLLSNAVCLALC